MKLYDYQIEVKSQVYKKIRDGKKKVLVIAITGSGKSIILASIIKDALSRKRKCLCLITRSILVTQLSETLTEFGIDHGRIKSGMKYEPGKKCYVAMLQSFDPSKFTEDFDVLIPDEAHETTFYKRFQDLLKQCYDPFVVGFTASPWRLKRTESLMDHYEDFVLAPVPAELIAAGYLVPGKYYGYDLRADLKSVKTVNGDYSQEDLAIACNTPELVAHAVDQFKRICPSRKAIVFAVNVTHSKALAQAFREEGFIAVHVDGKTKEAERKIIYRQLEKGEIQVLCSCNVTTTGFNVKSIDCVIAARPTKSRALWLQQLGRGMRSFPGKENYICLDQAGNNLRFGFPEDLTASHLHPAESANPDEKGEPPARECPKCGSQCGIGLRVCPECGYTWPLNEKEKFIPVEDFVEQSAKSNTQKINFFKAKARMAFNSNKTFGLVAASYFERFNEWPPREIQLHAIFGGINTAANQRRFSEYLIRWAIIKKKGNSWIINHMKGEFGDDLNNGLVQEIKSKDLSGELSGKV